MYQHGPFPKWTVPCNFQYFEVVRAILKYGADLCIDPNVPFSRHTRNWPSTNGHSKVIDGSIKALNKNGTVILPPSPPPTTDITLIHSASPREKSSTEQGQA